MASFPDSVRTWTPLVNGDPGDVNQINPVYEEVTAIETYLSTEIPLLNSTDTLISTTLSTNVSTSISSDALLTNNLSSETSSRVSGDTLLTTNLSTEVSSRISGDTLISTSLSSHVGSGGSSHAVATTSVNGFMSASDKTKLDGLGGYIHPSTHPATMITLNTTNFNGNLTTSETNVQLAMEKIDDLVIGGLSAETSSRISGDTLLTTNLSSETSSRVSGDTLLTTNLSAETSSRVSGDTLLTTNLSSETSLRTVQSSSISTSISSETSSRVSGDTLLTTNLSSETSSRVSGDTLLTTNLSTEISNRLVQNKVYHGILDRSTVSPLPTNITTTTFTLQTGTTPMTYYHQGNKITVSTNVSTTLNDGTAGIYYVYWNNGFSTISATKSFPGILSTSDVIIATVCWNGSNYGLVNDERHSYDRSLAWHRYQHQTVGTRYGSGLTLTHNSGTGAAATFALTTGYIWDEDIYFNIPASSSFPVSNTCRLCYQNSAITYTFDNAVSTTPFKMGANNRPVYVDNNYNIIEMTSAVNRYINFFVYVTTDVHTPMHVFTETVSVGVAANNGYNTLTDARAVGFPNLSQIALSPEYKAIYRLIVRADGVLQTIDTNLDDYRLTTAVPISAGIAQNNAINISATPHSAYLLGTNVQVQLDQTETSLSTATNNLSAETSSRVSGDTLLTTNLSSETSSRVSGDTLLTTNLSSETSSRISGDTLLTTNLSSETSSRVSGDTLLSTALSTDILNLSSETSSRISGDTLLSTALSTDILNLSSEISSRVSGDTLLSTELSTETSIRFSTDGLLGTELSSQASFIWSIRTSTDSTISTETSTRISVDTVISGALSTDILNLSSETSSRISADELNIPKSVVTAAGDIIYATSSATLTNLAKGTDGQVLTLASGLPSWADATGGSIADANVETVSTTKSLTISDKIYQIYSNTGGGSPITVNLPSAGLYNGLYFVIKNNMAANYSPYDIKSGGTSVVVLYKDVTTKLYYNGSAWIVEYCHTSGSGTNNRVSFGNGAKAYNSGSSTSFGANATADSDSTSFGTNAYAIANSNAIGKGSSAGTTDYANALGRNATTTTGNYGTIVIGEAATASGGHVIGRGASNTQNTGQAYGYYAKTERWNEQAYKFKYDASTTVRYYYSRFQWEGTTTDATPLEIFLGGTSNKRALVLASSVYSFEGQILCREAATQDIKVWKIEGAIKRDASNNTSLVGVVTKTVIAADVGATTWDLTVTADDTNEALIITVTGEAAHTIIWHGVFHITEMRP